jgi:hypothetical protein
VTTDVVTDAHLIAKFDMCWKMLQRSILCFEQIVTVQLSHYKCPNIVEGMKSAGSAVLDFALTSKSGWSATFQALARKKALMLSGHTVCFTDRHLYLEMWVYFRLLSELLTMSKEVHWEKECDDMEAEHTALLYYCETRWPSHAKLFHRDLNAKQKQQFV